MEISEAKALERAKRNIIDAITNILNATCRERTEQDKQWITSLAGISDSIIQRLESHGFGSDNEKS